MFGQPPPFSLTKPRYDTTTYIGRTQTFLDNTTSDLVLATQADVERAKRLLEAWKQGTAKASDIELWDARKTVEGCTHPDTGETIFPLFRFAAFAPVNYLIIPIMLHPAVVASGLGTAAIHIANQSYNSAVNYSNRNASNPTPASKLFQSYCLAVGSSVGIALVATKMVQKANARGGSGSLIIRSTLPFLAVAVAGNLNVCFMRKTELVQGVDLVDEEGTVHGRSVTAGKIGLAKCGLARVLWNIPSMTAAPLLINSLQKLSIFKKSKFANLAMQVGVYGAAIRYGVPPSLAVFPQYDSISASTVEPEFQNKVTKSGKKIEKFYFNKGL